MPQPRQSGIGHRLIEQPVCRRPGQFGVDINLPGGQLALGGLGRKPEAMPLDVLRLQVKIRRITDFDECLFYSLPAPSSG